MEKFITAFSISIVLVFGSNSVFSQDFIKGDKNVSNEVEVGAPYKLSKVIAFAELSESV